MLLEYPQLLGGVNFVVHHSKKMCNGIIFVHSCFIKSMPFIFRPNLVLKTGDLYMITEFACHGNMRDFLRSRRLPDSTSGYEKPLSHWQTAEKPLTYKDLISFAYQIARGMEYLASKKVR